MAVEEGPREITRFVLIILGIGIVCYIFIWVIGSEIPWKGCMYVSDRIGSIVSFLNVKISPLEQFCNLLFPHNVNLGPTKVIK